MMDYFSSFINEFWSLSLEMSPWLLFGLFIAGLLHVFLPTKTVLKQLGGRGLWPITKGVIFGIPLPLCSCGVIPTAIQLNRQGASKATTNAFLISTPQTGVDSMMATFALLGWPFALIRPILALLSGILGGVIMEKGLGDEENSTHTVDQNSAVRYNSILDKWAEVFRYGFIEMVRDIGKWLVIGLALAAVIGLALPDQFFTDQVPNFFAQMLLVILISVPLYVCATGSIPIALVLLSKGLAPALVLLFLMLGPATNIASVVLISNGIGRKFFNWYLVSIVFASFLAALGVHFLVSDTWLLNGVPNLAREVSMHQHYDSPFRQGLTILLFGLVIYTFFPKKRKSMSTNNNTNHEIQVDGMSCNKCKNLIETELNSDPDITNAEVNLDRKTVSYSGSVSEQEVKSRVKELGYSPVE